MPVDQNIYTAIKEQKTDPNYTPTVVTPGAHPTPPIDPPPPPAATQDTPPPITPPSASQAPPAFDETAWITEKFGGKFKSFDELQAELNKPPVVEYQVKAPEFPNETTKHIYESLTTGKELDVLPYLEIRKLANEVQTMTPEERIKRQLQYEYGLTPEMAAREYERQYVPDETGLSSVDVEIEKRKAQTKLERDSQNAIKYFTQKAEEIKLQPIQQPSAQPVQLTDAQKQAFEAGGRFTVDKVSKFPFEYDAQEFGMKIQGEVSLPSERVTQIKQQIEKAPEAFLAGFLSRFYTPDGKVNADALARDAVYLDEPTSWATEVAKKTFTDTLTNRLAQERNRQTGSNITGGPFNAPAEESQKNAIYKGFRIPAENKPAVTAPQG